MRVYQKIRMTVTVVFLCLILLMFFFNNDWGISDKKGTSGQETPSSIETTAPVATPSPENTPPAQPDTTTTLSVTDTDTLPTSYETPETITEPNDTLASETETPALATNLIEVKRKDGKLLYTINGQETDNLVQGLTLLVPDKEVILKMSGNITYAEGQSVKETLEVKEITYKEVGF